MQLANQEAQRFNHEYIGTEHILLGLSKEGGVASMVLRAHNIDIRTIRLAIEQLVCPGLETGVTMGKRPSTPRAKKVIEYAMQEARTLGFNYVGTEHILIGLLIEQEGIAANVLRSSGVTLESARLAVKEILSNQKNESATTPETIWLATFQVTNENITPDQMRDVARKRIADLEREIADWKKLIHE